MVSIKIITCLIGCFCCFGCNCSWVAEGLAAGSTPRRTTPSTSTSITSSASASASATTATNDQQISQNNHYLLHQNWWPVTLEDAVAPGIPNPIDLLGHKLVLFHDGDDWKCLDDRCSHRFAPLSEGRVAEPTTTEDNHNLKKTTKKKCLQCSYHGWEFQGDGRLSYIPRKPQLTTTKQGCVTSYPVKRVGGMLWVWPDATTETLAQQSPIPISPLLEQYTMDYPRSGFMRDLPYGYELLAENLMDVSHLPFAHHGAGGFDRDLARPMEFQLMKEPERIESTYSEYYNYDNISMEGPSSIESNDGSSEKAIPIPALQIKLMNATYSDPTLVMFTKAGKEIPNNATSTSAFFAPSHIRYRRNRGYQQGANIEMFLCPTAPGKSRVFLFTSIERFLKHNLDSSVRKKNSIFGRWKERFINRRIRSVLSSPNWKGHMVAHDIFDGDGIFLHLQGERMKQEGLTWIDYYTPTSTDLLVRAFRQWVATAAAQTAASGNEVAAHAVLGGSMATATGANKKKTSSSSIDTNTELKRSVMLDRYATHTQNCRICQKALQKFERRRGMLRTIKTIWLGSIGASLSLVLLGVVSTATKEAWKVARPGVSLLLASALLSFWTNRMENKVKKNIEKFHFVDYSHAQ